MKPTSPTSPTIPTLSNSIRASLARSIDQNEFPLPMIFPGATSPVGNFPSFRLPGEKPSSPMTREELRAVLQEAMDIIDNTADYFDDDEPAQK